MGFQMQRSIKHVISSMAEAWSVLQKSLKKSRIHPTQANAGLDVICDSINTCDLLGWSLQGILKLYFKGHIMVKGESMVSFE